MATSLGGKSGLYSGPPFLCNIDTEIQKELNNRAKNRLRPITPFIKVTPGFRYSDNDKSKVIFTGILSPSERTWDFKFNELYKESDGYRPVGGVTNLVVEYKNVTGAVRKAALSWICHSLNDLERIGPYFLAPGRTMLIEYGWNQYIGLDGNTYGGSGYSLKKGSDFTLSTYYAKVRKDVINSKGNYDAVLGIITNYDVTMNPDGGFTCVTHVTSVGDLMGGIKMNEQHFDDKNLSGNSSESLIPLKQFIENILDAVVISKLDTNIAPLDIPNNRGLGTYYEPGDDTRSSFISRFANENKTAIFLSWGFIEDYVINPFLPYTLEKVKYVQYNSRDSRIRTNKWLRTTELGVCIIPFKSGNPNEGYNFSDFTILNTEENIQRKYGNPRNILVNIELFKEIFLKATSLDEAVASLFAKINDACANLWKFSIRTRDEIDDITSNEKPPLCIKEIVDLNFSGGHNFNKISPYEFKIKSFKVKKDGDSERATGIIRNIALSTKLSNDAALNVFDSATNDDGKGIPGSENIFRSLWNHRKKGVNPGDDFVGANSFPSKATETERAKEYQNDPIYKATMERLEKENTERLRKEQEEKKSTISPEDTSKYGTMAGWPPSALRYLPIYDTFYSPDEWDPPGFTEKALTLGKGREMMRSLFTYSKASGTDETPSTWEAVVPMQCEIELEGISGIRAGDAFTVDNLPQSYKEKGVFQVTNITHEVNRETWKTKLKSSYRIQKISGDMRNTEIVVPATPL